jgi:tetratricopeptide (TPR) repeat protein
MEIDDSFCDGCGAKSKKNLSESLYQEAVEFKKSKNYEAAIENFKQLGDYLDSKELLNFCMNENNQVIYSKAIKLKNQAVNISEYMTALKMLREIKSYREANIYINECCESIYNMTLELTDTGLMQDIVKAKSIFESIYGYRDSAELANQLGEQIKRAKGNSKICPKCDKVNQATKTHCEECGTSLNEPFRRQNNIVSPRQNKTSHYSKQVNNTFIWLVSLMPLIWQVFLVVLTDDPVSASANYLWLIYSAINLILILIDRKFIKEDTGQSLDVSLGWILFFPAYLYKRANVLGQSKAYFGIFFLAVILGIVVHLVYLQIYFQDAYSMF